MEEQELSSAISQIGSALLGAPSGSEPSAPVSALAELLARVEAATAPDRELDAAIHVALSDGRLTEHDAYGWVKGPNDIGEAPRLTASLDAALALVERVLPGRSSELTRDAWSAVSKDHALHIRRWDRATDGSYAQSLALALLAALLKVLSASTASPAIGPAHRLDAPNPNPATGGELSPGIAS